MIVGADMALKIIRKVSNIFHCTPEPELPDEPSETY
jgi:hypothetical protein